MKKIVSCLMAVLMTVMLTACGSTSADKSGEKTNHTSSQSEAKKIRVVCTIFPQYDWVRQIVGEDQDNVEVTLLGKSGTDLHNYQPSTDDIIKISECDLFIYVGGESDSWAEDALENVKNENRVAVNLLEVLGSAVKEEELVEGMEEGDEEAHEEEAELDEHVWLSLKNAKTACTSLAEILGEIDADNASLYKDNAEKYNQELSALDAEYTEAMEAAPTDVLLFADRFPFRYLADDYEINYYAAFAGCSAETEASFETIVFLAGKVDELGLKNVMVVENCDQSIAKTVVENTKEKDQNILELNSMQSVTAADIESGVTYLAMMERNLEVLKDALSD